MRRPDRSGRPPDSALVSFVRHPAGPSAPRWWRGEDLNPRRRSPADLQSAPFGQLGYLAIRTVDSSGTHSAGRHPALVADIFRARRDSLRWSWRRESNPRPAAYKAAALPLSYASKRQNFILCTGFLCVNPILRPAGSRGGPEARRPLAPDLVEEGRPRGRNVEGPYPAGQGDPHQDVAAPRDQRP